MWRIASRTAVLKNPFVQVTKKLVYKDGDGPHEYFSFDFADFCNVLPVTADGHLVLVKQFRIGLEADSLELPGGVVDDSDPNPEFSALRELREETGYGLAEGGRVQSLGWVHPNPAVQGNRCHLFAVGPVEVKGPPSFDPLEYLEVVLVPLGEIPELLTSGKITHSLALNAFCFLTLRNAGQSLVTAMDALRR